MQIPELRGAMKWVLSVLAFHAKPDGSFAFPCQARIAVEAGICERHVRRCLKELEEKGYIERMGKRKSRRGRPVVIWRVTMSLLKADSKAVRTAIQQITNTKQRLGKALRWKRMRIQASSRPWKDTWEAIRYQPGEPLPSLPAL